jgi:hypothetical protein
VVIKPKALKDKKHILPLTLPRTEIGQLGNMLKRGWFTDRNFNITIKN